jgi:hypothetical protein
MFKESILMKIIFIFLVTIFLSSIFGLLMLKSYWKIDNEQTHKKLVNAYEKK